LVGWSAGWLVDCLLACLLSRLLWPVGRSIEDSSSISIDDVYTIALTHAFLSYVFFVNERQKYQTEAVEEKSKYQEKLEAYQGENAGMNGTHEELHG
jgi:hypothetical protein